MTTDVAVTGEATPFKQIVGILQERRVSAAPGIAERTEGVGALRLE